MRKIVFVDIDGTIIDCTRKMELPSPKTKDAFKKLKDNGTLVFIASGRAMCLLPKSIVELNPSGYLLANGAYSEVGGKVLFSNSMALDEKKRIEAFCEKYNAVYYFETRDNIYTQDLNHPIHKNFEDMWNVRGVYTDKGYHDDLDINIGMLAIPEDDNIAKKVYEELGDYVVVNRHPYLYSFDLNIKNTSKGSGILKIVDKLDIPITNTYAFGDGYNDIEMLETVGMGIAMENGVEDLKKVAKDITLDVLDDGFYYGLKKYALID